MLGTFIAIAFAAYGFFFRPVIDERHLYPLIAVTVLFACCVVILYGIAWIALQRAALKATPQLLLFYGARHRWLLMAFYLLSGALLFLPFLSPLWLFVIWGILVGLFCDLLRHNILSLFSYLTPLEALPLYGGAIRQAIRQEQPKALCQWVDITVTAALQAVARYDLSFALKALEELHYAFNTFLIANKSISYHAEKAKVRGEADMDVYISLFILQRMYLISRESLSNGFDPLSSGIAITLGKMTVDAAKYDISVASYPLVYLGRMACDAAAQNNSDILSKCNYTLLELSRQITEQVDLSFQEVADFFVALVSQLDFNARVLLKIDKSMKIELLTQPLLQLKSLFQAEKWKNHRDTPAILSAIDTALEQFNALESLLGPRSETMTSGRRGEATPMDDEGVSSRIVADLEERLGHKGSTDILGNDEIKS